MQIEAIGKMGLPLLRQSDYGRGVYSSNSAVKADEYAGLCHFDLTIRIVDRIHKSRITPCSALPDSIQHN